MAVNRKWVALGLAGVALAIQTWQPPLGFTIALLFLSLLCIAWGFFPIELRRALGFLGSVSKPALWILDKADQVMSAFDNRAISSEIGDRIRHFDECFEQRITPKTFGTWVEWYKRLRIDTEDFLERSISREARFRFRAAKPTGSESYDHAIDDNNKAFLGMIDAKRRELRNILAEKRS